MNSNWSKRRFANSGKALAFISSMTAFGLVFFTLTAASPRQRADSLQSNTFLRDYNLFLRQQAHRLRWVPEITTGLLKKTNQSLTFRQEFNPLKFSSSALASPAFPFEDAAGRWIAAHSGAGYQPLLLSSGGSALNQTRWERHPIKKLNFLPSALEIDLLQGLWEDPLQSGPELYKNLTPQWRITAEQLNGTLKRMVYEGLVERKQISPQNLFTFATFVGTYQVEESALNRENRVFIYRSLVNRKALLAELMKILQTERPGSQKREELKNALFRLYKKY